MLDVKVFLVIFNCVSSRQKVIVYKTAFSDLGEKTDLDDISTQQQIT